MQDQLAIELLIGESALIAIKNKDTLAEWRSLCELCPCVTSFQSYEFVSTWYLCYDNFTPVIISCRDRDSTLSGLWLLAFNPTTKELVHAGAHQAEYHTWVVLPNIEPQFLEASWELLLNQFPFHSLRFKFLPDSALLKVLEVVPSIKTKLITRIIPRPLLLLSDEEVKATASKKSNKSKINRLRKLGELNFYQIKTRDELSALFDQLISLYDFRQSAINNTTPFADDIKKRQFHEQLLTQFSDKTVLTVTELNNQPIAWFWGLISNKMLHLGVIAYSPTLSAHSPGKLHLMQLSQHLLDQKIDTLDLTPGGDLWKERFANAHDSVLDVTIYRSTISKQLKVGLSYFSNQLKCLLKNININPGSITSFFSSIKNARLNSFLKQLQRWLGESKELRIYRVDRSTSDRYVEDNEIAKNSLDHLLCFKPSETWHSRQKFLSESLQRLENGGEVYSLCENNTLAHYGWLSRNKQKNFFTEVKQEFFYPEKSATLYDFYTYPSLRNHGLYRRSLSHMIRKAFSDSEIQFVYIYALANNAPSRHVIESIGFQYQGSLFLKRMLGKEKKWDNFFHNQETEVVGHQG